MVYFSDARETSNLFGDYIEQVQQVLAANHLHFGSPPDFPALTETLETRSRLRDDLAYLARSFMAGEQHVSLRTVLSIIAIASGGPELATSDSDMSQPVSVLVDFLISAGGGRPASGEDRDSPRSDSINAPSYQAEIHQEEPQPYLPPPPPFDRHTLEHHEEEPEPYLPPPPPFDRHTPEHHEEESYQPFLPPPPSLDRHTPRHETLSQQIPSAQIDPDPETVKDPVPETVPEPANDTADLNPLETAPTLPNLDPLPPSDTGSSLVESLTRLELNSLQVKHYLDSIDQRISRIEPRLDNLPTQVTPPTPPQLVHAAEARYSSVLASEPLPDMPQDEPLAPPPPPAQTAKPPEMIARREPPPQVPRRAPLTSKLVIPVTTAVATALLVSLLYWGFSRNTSSITIQPAPASTAENRTPTAPNAAPAAGVSTSNPPVSATAPPPQNPAAAAPTLPTRADTRSLSHPAPIHRGVSSPRSSATTTQPSTPAADSARIPLPKPSAASLAGPEDSTHPFTLTEPVNVSSGIMAANVLSAPQPSYPKLASLTRMQGAVVMQAIISKEGTIEDLHVIKGHRLLRGAATNAVRTWRYRPYLINGQPVQVATTVSVDFKLPR